ncbi:MAG: hypothetical protein J6Y08_02335 [Clostridiales bacterium]|nr:hypothetical protein [Clostridiales bacterium]
MKKIIAISTSLILTAGIVTGCSGKPGKKETRERLERLCGGENIEIDGEMVRSLDRDLEFSYWYEWEGTPIWPDIDIPLGGNYYLRSDYGMAINAYWNDEYRSCIEKYDFYIVDYGKDGEDEDNCHPNLLYIFIEDGASSEDLEKVESLLRDLREICREEEEFHTSEWKEGFKYLAYIWYIDSDTKEYQKSNGVVIKADTKDKDLQLDNIRIASTDKSDPRKPPLSNGNAKIYVNEI